MVESCEGCRYEHIDHEDCEECSVLTDEQCSCHINPPCNKCVTNFYVENNSNPYAED